MILLTDPVEVFRLLEKHGEESFDFNQPHCAFFPCENYAAVLIFCPLGICKGPRLYLFPVGTPLGEVEAQLIRDLNEIIGDIHFENTIALAQREIRQRLESGSASGFFFDAH